MPRKKSQKLNNALNDLNSDSGIKLLNELLRLVKEHTSSSTQKDREEGVVTGSRVLVLIFTFLTSFICS